MYRPEAGPLILFAVLALSLGACSEQGFRGASGSTATAAAERPAATRLTQREVEAPQVFQKTEAGLWDGRPSLGGVWVAHPDVTDPERVLIRNEATGETVVGALFRRERENPGPRFQVSSDAAAALGLIAGAPTKLSVTALRQEDAPAQAEDDSDGTAVAGADTAQESAVAEPAESQQGGGLFAFLRGDRNKSEASADGADEAGETVATAEDAAPLPQTAAASTPEDDLADDAGQVGEPEGEVGENEGEASTPRRFLFGLFSRERSGSRNDTAADMSAPEVTATALPHGAPEAGSGLERGMVQIGIFSIEGNADRTADMMRENGLTPTVYEHASAGKSYWRVVVGPATTRSERDRLQARARNLGFTDAFPVSR